MSALEYTVYSIRRGWQLSGTYLFAGAFAALFASGFFAHAADGMAHRWIAFGLFAAWAVVFGLKAHRRFITPVGAMEVRRCRMDLEIGLLLVVATHAAVQIAGGISSIFYPIIFVLVAFLVVYTPQWVGFALVAAAIGIEFSLVLLGPGSTELYQVAIHSVFIVFFAIINLVFTRTEVARIRRHTQRQVEKAKQDLVSDARDFRLTVPARGHGANLSRAEEETRLSHAAVSELRSTIYHNVDLLRRTLDLHTCAVFWLDARGEKLRILECVSSSDTITAHHIDRGEGVLGAILSSAKPVRLKGLRTGYTGLPYYEVGAAVTDFLGVPVIERGHVRGVICADRVSGRHFGDMEEHALLGSVDNLLNAITTERVFRQLQKAKSEQGKLLGASEALSSALAEKDVVTSALEAARQIANFDIAAMALLDGSNRKQFVVGAEGDGSELLQGVSVGGGSSLVAAALKNKHFLPYRGELDPKQQIVFDKKTQKAFAEMRSALVLPLTAGDDALGTLTIAAKTPGAYGEDVRTTLQVMTNQLGTSLQNARMIQRLEEMATTDGLTGLPNHRTFQEELEKKLASSIRFNTELSVILCDVDKFKNVNDTYGHPVGDTVLRGLGETLRRNVVRDTDMPARYGGEEFIILCEGTGTEGAYRLAERVRKDLESQVFHTDQGELRCTISMGIATYPIHARTKEDLVERADAALYCAKEGGRNQSRTWENDMTGS